MSGRMPPPSPSHRTTFVLSIILLAVCLIPFGNVIAADRVPLSPDASAGSSLEFLSEPWELPAASSIDARVLQLALKAATCAIRSGDALSVRTLTVIDYSRPSTEERLWVFDLETRALEYQELVAHGQGSGENLATRFSNEPGTHASSLGLFATADTYVGRNGYSLRLQGLDSGFNDRAFERAIVMHGAPYVNPAVVKTQGRLGRSWGCPALRDGVARQVIDLVKGNGLVFAYYPDEEWLRTSRYLGLCDTPDERSADVHQSSNDADVHRGGAVVDLELVKDVLDVNLSGHLAHAK